MVPTFNIAADIRAATARLTLAQQRQVPFATARALTDLAFQVQRAEAAAIPATFRNPRPFTRRAVRVEKATKGVPVATVFVLPQVARYLAPYEFGGKHVLPGTGRALLNPVNIRLDAYGQISGPPRAIGDRPDVFAGVVNTRSGPIWGFWQRLMVSKMLNPGVRPQRLKLLVRAGDALEVTKRLGFRERAREVVAANAGRTMQTAVAQALATAR